MCVYPGSFWFGNEEGEGGIRRENWKVKKDIKSVGWRERVRTKNHVLISNELSRGLSEKRFGIHVASSNDN